MCIQDGVDVRVVAGTGAGAGVSYLLLSVELR